MADMTSESYIADLMKPWPGESEHHSDCHCHDRTVCGCGGCTCGQSDKLPPWSLYCKGGTFDLAYKKIMDATQGGD